MTGPKLGGQTVVPVYFVAWGMRDDKKKKLKELTNEHESLFLVKYCADLIIYIQLTL